MTGAIIVWPVKISPAIRACGISEGFWRRKSAEWEAELQTVDAERARLERSHVPVIATAEKILELAKKAEILYKSQNPGEQRRLLETLLSNCTLTVELSVPPTLSRSTCW